MTTKQTLPIADNVSKGGTSTGEQLRISETFRSRQGEGGRAGNESFFIRTSGCNLRCWFCDTPYASWQPTGDVVPVEKVVAQASASTAGDVVVTGGEPLLWKPIETLVDRLRRSGLHVTIETAGTIWRDVRPDLLSLSPKLRDSGPSAADHPRWSVAHERRRLPIETMRRLIEQAAEVQVKFVISDAEQMAEASEVGKRLQVRGDQIWIMPEGTSVEAMDRASQWLRPLVDAAGFRYADRMHIRWYGNRRGT